MRPSSPQELLERFGSPLYVYDADLVAARWRRLREALPPGTAVHYAMKANPSLGILALLRSLGAGVEIASGGELEAARRAGFPPDRVLYAGPGKTEAELEAAAAAGIAAIHAESATEIARLDAIGQRRGRPVPAGLRVQVPWAAQEERTIIGGAGTTKFGIGEAEARERAAEWARLPGVRLSSLHVFNASNVRDAAALVEGASKTFALARDLAEAGLDIEQVDVGGGLGVPSAPGDAPLDVEALGAGLGRIVEEPGRRFRLAIEPGRWLVADCGRLLTRVIDVKVAGGVEFLVVDAGIHHLLRPALIGEAHPIVRAGFAPQGAPRSCRVVGPLCTSLDSFGDHELPPTRPGDVLAIERAGAYGFTEAMPHFLSHPVPAEVMLVGDEPHLLRARREVGWHLEGQRIPEILAPET